MAGRAPNDGQHRAVGSGAPGQDRGQRGRLDPGVNVGHLSGGENQMNVPSSGRDSDIATTHYVGGAVIEGRVRLRGLVVP